MLKVLDVNTPSDVEAIVRKQMLESHDVMEC